MPRQRRISSPDGKQQQKPSSAPGRMAGSPKDEEKSPGSSRLPSDDKSHGNGTHVDEDDGYHKCGERKIHRRSLLETLHVFLLTKTHYLVRIISACALTVCTVSVLQRTQQGSPGLSSSSPSLDDGMKRNLVLFQKTTPVMKRPAGKAIGGRILSQAGYSTKPRVVGCYWPHDPREQQLAVERLDMNLVRLYTDRFINMSPRAVKSQLHQENSKDYLEDMADPLYDGDCVPQYDWQAHSKPSCNTVHELSALYDMKGTRKSGVRVKYLDSGYWRDVWMVRDADTTWEPIAMKTLRLEHAPVDRNFDRHRREAVAMERLTPSPNILDIYGFCGNTALFEFATGGTLNDAIWHSKEAEWNSTEKLVVAYQVAVGIADTHNSDLEGRASIAHTDISPSQFVFVKKYGRFLLNDFNRCRLLLWNNRTNEPCGFDVGNNPGTYRAPEEYAYERETEKVDVYSMGNIFYALLTKMWPFEEMDSTRKIQNAIKDGKRPPIGESIVESKDPFTMALLKALKMCWIQDPTKRATARQVEKFLDGELTKLGVHSEAEQR